MKIIRQLLILTAITAGVTSAAKTPDTTRPNMIWIFSDDHSFQTIGAYGGRLQGLNPTPNIDRMAQEGKLFTRCYVNAPMCSPARWPRDSLPPGS